jgi:hypothetical protein
MDTTWRTTDTGEIVFRSRAPFVGRAFVGCALGFPALFFLYHLVDGLVEYRTATLHEWLVALPGFLLVLALSLSFGVPAWCLATLRRRVVVDAAGGRVLQVLDFLVWRKVKTYPISQVVTFQVRDARERSSRARARKPFYAAELVLTTGETMLVGLEDSLHDANRVARAVGRCLGKAGPPEAQSQE